MTALRDEKSTGRSKPDLLGIGLYTIPETARLLRIPTARLRRWAVGYKFSTDLGSRPSSPVIRRALQDTGSSETLTFLDLIELYFVDLLRTHSVSMQTIRAAAANAARIFGKDHPFALKGLLTDGRNIFASIEPRSVTGVSPDRALLELSKGQYVMEQLARSFLKNLDYDAEIAERWWPLGRDSRVVIDPERSFGKPIDSITGVPTWALYLMREGGESVEGIARIYRVDTEAVSAAVEYEEYLRAA